MSKAEDKAQSAIELVQTWLALRAEGHSSDQAAAQLQLSRSTLENYRRKYLPELTLTKQTLDKNGKPQSTIHGIRENGSVDTTGMRIKSVTKSPYGGAFVKYENKEEVLSYEQIRDELIDAMKKHAPKYPSIKRPKLVEPHLLVVDINDVHIGKYSSPTETGEIYDIETAKRRATEGLHGLLNKSQGFPTDKILFVVGNDIVHYDSPTRKTTSGTPQDTDKQLHEACNAARELYVYMLEVLVGIADVHVVFNPSNHDFVVGNRIVDSLYCWFHNSKNITFDIDMKHRKYFQYGNSLIATTHGDGAKEKDLVKLMAEEAKQMWADTTYRYWYCHHIHHRVIKDDIGASIQYLRSPSSADAWHHRNGYITKPAVECFIHHPTEGQIANFTHYCT